MHFRVIAGGAVLVVACSSELIVAPGTEVEEEASSARSGPSGFGGDRAQSEPTHDEDAAPAREIEASSMHGSEASTDASRVDIASDASKVDRKVLFVAGEAPMVGVDLQIHDLLRTQNIEVEDARETVSPARAEGKGLIIISYSVSSTSIQAADFIDLPVPIMLLEHFLLPELGMTSADGHGYEPNVTQISLRSSDPILSAGLTAGDVTVYSQVGEVFWGTPSSAAITVATVKGDPTRAVSFAYPTGAAMVGRIAKAKRMQFFVAAHAPPPNPQPFLNANGLALLGGAIGWCLQ